MKVWLGDRRVSVAPSMSIGKGGEAEVYAVAGDRALKIFKAPDHPDFAGLPAEQRAAEARIAEHQTKLRELPDLGERIITPLELATGGRRRGGPVVGYAMALIEDADPLYRFSDPRFRRTRVPGQRVVAILRDLYDRVRSVHDAGAVIGDFNDLNVLVRDTRAFVIDADSFQFGRYRCAVFTERFVDPLLCEPPGDNVTSPVLIKPHTRDSDWYAFAILAMRSLLCVGPYGGVHRPSNGDPRIPHPARPLHRVTVFSDQVTYPKPALHWSALPDELLDHLAGVFERDRRGRFPEDLLETLRWTRCRSCGAEHARPSCPGCVRPRPPRPPVRVRGSVRAVAVEGEAAAAIRRRAAHRHRNDRHRFWIAGSSLWFDGPLGDLRLGRIVGGRTRFWVGERLGAGFYTAGALTFGFVFDAARPLAGNGINDQVALPPMRGALMDAACAVGRDRAWLFAVEQVGGVVVGRCTCVSAAGEVVATTSGPIADHPWLAAGAGACAAGDFLFVATDAGVARFERDGAAIAQTRSFPDTEPFVDASTRLLVTERGLCAITRDEVVELHIRT